MFDNALGLTMLCAANFRQGVRDSFGASLLADVLDPMLKDIDSLRIFNEDFQRHALQIDRLLETAQAMQLNDHVQAP